MSKRDKKYKAISRRLTDQELRKLDEKEISLSDDELLGAQAEKSASLFFLGYYSRQGIELALQKYGVFKEFERLGFGNLQLLMDTQDPYRQRLAIYSVIEKLNDRCLLAEVVVKRRYFTLEPPFQSAYAGRSFEVLGIEWICLQDPRKKFTPERPRLPGQQYPGLGGGRTALQLLTLACKRLRLAGILNVPEYFHNAQMYSKAFGFIDPRAEGKRRAIERDLMSRYDLATVSWALDLSCVQENGKPFKWFIAEQLVPLHSDLKDYFREDQYLALVKQHEAHYRYQLDENCWRKKKKILY